jgi:DNA-binding protein H-NS
LIWRNTLHSKHNKVDSSLQSEPTMRAVDFGAMSVDELWVLRETIISVLTTRLVAEKQEIQNRLDKLGGVAISQPITTARFRRPYPRVSPKFQNPMQPSQTWSGRGKQPRWVGSLLATGKTIDDLRISRASAS